MDQRFFTTEDFIQDERFQQWVYSPDESSDFYWETFLFEYPEKQKQVQEAREFLGAMKFRRVVPEIMIDRIRTKLIKAIDQPGERNPSIRSTAREVASRYLVAASVTIVLLAGCFLLIRDNGVFSGGVSMEAQETPKGKQQQVLLEDGTQVWLNASSKLTYASRFANGDTREVFLDGEAYFDVVENPKQPFIVHTSGIAIRVLGTAFNVRSYAGDSAVETTLVHGKVTIAEESDDSAKVTLLPEQQAVFSRRSRKFQLREVTNIADQIAWRDGWMVFEDKPFSYIKETLERWYDVEITMEDERSLSCTFSGKFKDKTLDEVLEIFTATESIRFEIDGNQVLIQGRLCKYDESNQ